MASEELLILLREAEGWQPKPYIDPVGKPTVGYGHLLPDLNHPEITVETGEALLNADVQKATDRILHLCPTLIGQPQARIDAMVDWSFNFGADRINKDAHGLHDAIQLKDWKSAGAQLRRWVWGRVHGQMQKLPGLVTRRATTSRWMETGSYA
jgi:lysozyme